MQASDLTYVGNNLQDLNTKSNTWWNIDLNKKALFQPRTATPASWPLAQNNASVRSDVCRQQLAGLEYQIKHLVEHRPEQEGALPATHSHTSAVAFGAKQCKRQI